MPGLIKKNHFIWLTIALIGLMLAGAFSRDLPDNLTLQLIEYTSVILLLLSLLSLKTDRYWGKGFLIIVGIMLTVVVARGATEIACWLKSPERLTFRSLIVFTALNREAIGATIHSPKNIRVFLRR